MLIRVRILLVLLSMALLSFPLPASGEGTIPIIDAHSQYDQEISLEEILGLMEQAGVSRVILAQRDKVKPRHLLSFASNHPDRIVPAVRTKSGPFIKGSPREFEKYLDGQIRQEGFGALAEVLIWHAEKYHHTGKEPVAPKVVSSPASPNVKIALKKAVRQGWPFIAHIEFAAIGPERQRFMSEFESLLREYPDHPFVLIHMGQLETDEVGRLITDYRNIHFLTAKCNPIANKNSTQPLVNLFKKNRLAPRWKKLISAHPDRFILGFDNVWVWHWKKTYVRQARFWRKALKDLPGDAAHLVAHGNAERLWGIQLSGK